MPGGTELITTRAGHDRINECWLAVDLIVLGAGKKLFSDGFNVNRFTLVESCALESGVLFNTSPAWGMNEPKEQAMRPLRYSINVTLDGCVDHRAGTAPDEELHRHHARTIEQADALLLGRVTYQMMEDAWRPAAETGKRPAWMADWMAPFARTIHAVKKYVVSGTLDRVDWNAELVRGDLAEAVRQLKREHGKGIGVGGVTLPLALAELGLIDEYEFVVHPRIAGHGPTLLAGLSKAVDLKLVNRVDLGSGTVAMRYLPK